MMSEIANFTLGMIVGILSMLFIILGWSLMNISGDISREERSRGRGWEPIPPLDEDQELTDRVNWIYDALEKVKATEFEKVKNDLIGKIDDRLSELDRPEPNPPDEDPKSS